MNLTQMRMFHAVVRTGTFTAAAQLLGVSQPAVTQQIRGLEEELGVKLFVRKGASIELTPSGAEFEAQAARIVRLVDLAEQSFAAHRELAAGGITIGVCSPYLVMPTIRAFSARHPGLRVGVFQGNSKDLVDGLLAYRWDLAMMTMKEPDARLNCTPLAEQQIKIIVPAGHPWKTRQSLLPADLAGVPLIIREEGSMTRDLLEDGMRAAGVGYGAATVFNSREAVKEAVASGLGLGIVLSQEVGFDSRLRAIPIEGPGFAAIEYLACLPDFARTRPIQEFIAVASEIFNARELN